MSYFNPLSLLVADIDRFQAMRGALKPDKSVDYSNQLLLILVIMAVIAGVTIAVRCFNRRKRQGYDHPLGLFRELCRAHRLDRGQVRLLREVAACLDLEHPSRLFLEPNLFEELLQDPRFSQWREGEKRERIDALQQCLFSGHLHLEQAIGA